MLQNKLGELDKSGGLWKIRGVENTANALAGLINVMQDLSSLATVHTIEGQLHEGGGLESDDFDWEWSPSKISYSEFELSLEQKKDWEKFQFLEQELHVREKLTPDNKTAQLMGFAMKNDKPIDGVGEFENI